MGNLMIPVIAVPTDNVATFALHLPCSIPPTKVILMIPSQIDVLMTPVKRTPKTSQLFRTNN